MPRSVSLVGLARKGVIPQNNSTTECFFYDPVVLGRIQKRPRHSTPADVAIATSQMARRRTPGPTGAGTALRPGHLLQVFADGLVRKPGNDSAPTGFEQRAHLRCAALANNWRSGNDEGGYRKRFGDLHISSSPFARRVS